MKRKTENNEGNIRMWQKSRGDTVPQVLRKNPPCCLFKIGYIKLVHQSTSSIFLSNIHARFCLNSVRWPNIIPCSGVSKQAWKNNQRHPLSSSGSKWQIREWLQFIWRLPSYSLHGRSSWVNASALVGLCPECKVDLLFHLCFEFMYKWAFCIWSTSKIMKLHILLLPSHWFLNYLKTYFKCICYNCLWRQPIGRNLVSLKMEAPRFPKRHLGFVIDEVALDRFSPLTSVFPVSIISPVLHTHSFIYYRRYWVFAIDRIFKNALEIHNKS
jgi:hypothetical protein